MPNYDVDEAKKQIEALRKDIENDRVYYLDLLKSLQDDKALSEEDQRHRHQVAKDRYSDILSKLHSQEQYSQSVVRDHMELKHVFELEERASNEENEALRQENLAIRNQIRDISSETN
jgi:hypothetical protein